MVDEQTLRRVTHWLSMQRVYSHRTDIADDLERILQDYNRLKERENEGECRCHEGEDNGPESL